VQAATSRRRPGGGRHPAFKVHPLKLMMLKHAVILTEDLLANDTIIDEGLRAFVAIVKDLGWQYGYVGASIKKTGCWAQSSSKGLFRSRVRS
jgi:hypothetical protein